MSGVIRATSFASFLPILAKPESVGRVPGTADNYRKVESASVSNATSSVSSVLSSIWKFLQALGNTHSDVVIKAERTRLKTGVQTLFGGCKL